MPGRWPLIGLRGAKQVHLSSGFPVRSAIVGLVLASLTVGIGGYATRGHVADPQRAAKIATLERAKAQAPFHIVVPHPLPASIMDIAFKWQRDANEEEFFSIDQDYALDGHRFHIYMTNISSDSDLIAGMLGRATVPDEVNGVVWRRQTVVWGSVILQEFSRQLQDGSFVSVDGPYSLERMHSLLRMLA